MNGPTDDLVDATALDDVERRLRAALSIKAGALPVADEVFDPDRPLALVEPAPLRRPASRGRRGRSASIAVAAAAAVAVGVVTWQGINAPPTSPDGATSVVAGATAASTNPSSVATSPAPVGPGLLASWVPAGYELIDVQLQQHRASSDPDAPVTQPVVPSGAEGNANVLVTAVFRDAGGRMLTVQTNTFEAGRYGYRGLESSGTVQADGSVVVVDRFDPARPTVMVAWPDGRKVSVVGVDLDDATMTRVASSIRASDDTELRTRRAEGSANMARLPAVATAAVPAGTVTVVGSSEPVGVCLTQLGHDPVCAANSFGYSDRISAGLLIDGQPYAVTATGPGAVSAGYGFVSVSGAGGWDASPIETGTGGGWRMLVTAPPADNHRDLGVGSVTDGQVASSSSIPWTEL
jgi:hypothetical protein